MKRVLVTGATSGIGRAMAVLLQGSGHAVTAMGRNAGALAALADAAPGIAPLQADLSDLGAVRAALAGRSFDVLVNNAGVMPRPGPFAAMAALDIDRTLAVNLQAVMHLTHLVLPGLRAGGAGHIVFVGSSAAHAPAANFAVYAATKAALSAFAASLRAEVAADGVRVTELVPGRVETALYSAVLDRDTRDAMYRDGTALQPEDVAQALLAVLSLPARADVTRLDLHPTRPVPPIRLT